MTTISTTLSTTQLNTFNYTGEIETAQITQSGYYDITADGAQGGAGVFNDAGALGALASGDNIYLAAGAQPCGAGASPGAYARAAAPGQSAARCSGRTYLLRAYPHRWWRPCP